MKKYLLAISMLLAMTTTFAQTKQKPAMKEDKIPTQKEMESIMKEIQKELDAMSPEDKKMMDRPRVFISTSIKAGRPF